MNSSSSSSCIFIKYIVSMLALRVNFLYITSLSPSLYFVFSLPVYSLSPSISSSSLSFSLPVSLSPSLSFVQRTRGRTLTKNERASGGRQARYQEGQGEASRTTEVRPPCVTLAGPAHGRYGVVKVCLSGHWLSVIPSCLHCNVCIHTYKYIFDFKSCSTLRL